MSDTPRTDELAREFAGKRISSKEVSALYDKCRTLERELAEAREDAVNQRRLAELALAHRDALIEERDNLEDALDEIIKTIPRSLSCHDFHHPKKDYHGYDEECNPTNRFYAALLIAEKTLATIKEKSK